MLLARAHRSEAETCAAQARFSGGCLNTNYRNDAGAIHDKIVARERARADREAALASPLTKPTDETPQEDIRNALAILANQMDMGHYIRIGNDDLEAVYARLWKAVRKLESEGGAERAGRV